MLRADAEAIVNSLRNKYAKELKDVQLAWSAKSRSEQFKEDCDASLRDEEANLSDVFQTSHKQNTYGRHLVRVACETFFRAGQPLAFDFVNANQMGNEMRTLANEAMQQAPGLCMQRAAINAAKTLIERQIPITAASAHTRADENAKREADRLAQAAPLEKLVKLAASNANNSSSNANSGGGGGGGRSRAGARAGDGAPRGASCGCRGYGCPADVAVADVPRMSRLRMSCGCRGCGCLADVKAADVLRMSQLRMSCGCQGGGCPADVAAADVATADVCGCCRETKKKKKKKKSAGCYLLAALQHNTLQLHTAPSLPASHVTAYDGVNASAQRLTRHLRCLARSRYRASISRDLMPLKRIMLSSLAPCAASCCSRPRRKLCSV